MSNGCSCIYIGDADYPVFQRRKIRTAKKEHICTECREKIKPGDRYEYATSLFRGWDRISINKTCPICLSIRDVFFCEGWAYEGVMEYLQEHLNDLCGHIEEDCIASLNDGARARVCSMIEEIWEETDWEDEDENP